MNIKKWEEVCIRVYLLYLISAMAVESERPTISIFLAPGTCNSGTNDFLSITNFVVAYFATVACFQASKDRVLPY